MKRALLAMFGIVALTGSSFAGLVDSPLPNIGGAMTLHLYSVTGVINEGGLGTYFTCTSTSTATIRVSVQVFQNTGGAPLNDASAQALAVSPGATVMFGTQNAFGLTEDQNLSVAAVSGGSARILSSAKQLVCTAMLADTGNSPPISLTNLNIIYKVKQKGQ